MPPPVTVTIPVWLQLIGAGSAWVLKPSYMLLTLYLIVRLWRRPEPELRWLCWGLVAFEAGESACAVNYVLYELKSVPWEMLHDGGMVIAIGLLTMGTLEVLDRKMLFQFVPGKVCSLIRFCRECPVRAGRQCRFRPLFAFVCAAGLFFSTVPLTKPAVRDHPMMVEFFGQPYLWYHVPLYQLFENRVYPAAAILLFCACGLLLWRRTDNRMVAERVLFSFGFAFMSFSLFRFANYRANWDWPVWFDFWEEATEWISIAGIAIVLHLFEAQLLGSGSTLPAPGGSASVAPRETEP